MFLDNFLFQKYMYKYILSDQTPPRLASSNEEVTKKVNMNFNLIITLTTLAISGSQGFDNSVCSFLQTYIYHGTLLIIPELSQKPHFIQGQNDHTIKVIPVSLLLDNTIFI